MSTVVQARLTQDFRELAARAQARYDALTPSQKLRHRYMQRRSFAIGMCSSSTPLEIHRANVDKLMPHETTLSDAEIGLILVGERPC